MRQELDDKLCQKYPKIFVQRNKDPRETAMCWGFECGDGWFWLIDQLCANIQGYIDANPHLKIPQVEAVQVKEKFGGLRFYYDGGDQEIQGRISFAEYLSYSICDECGTTENVGSTSGWLRTICKPCFDKWKVTNRVWKPKKKNEETNPKENENPAAPGHVLEVDRADEQAQS